MKAAEIPRNYTCVADKDSEGCWKNAAIKTKCRGWYSTYNDFKNANNCQGADDYIAMLIDSEDPITEIDKTWEHLHSRDKWEKPDNASDEQVLFMTTCMETWIVADRETLSTHYGHELQLNALPSVNNLENKSRQDIQDKLEHATRNCSNAYKKGKRSFVVLGELNPLVLKKHLPSFHRTCDILDERLENSNAVRR